MNPEIHQHRFPQGLNELRNESQHQIIQAIERQNENYVVIRLINLLKIHKHLEQHKLNIRYLVQLQIFEQISFRNQYNESFVFVSMNIEHDQLHEL